MDFYKMYKDVDAVTDMPAFYFWKQILEAFPDAKVYTISSQLGLPKKIK